MYRPTSLNQQSIQQRLLWFKSPINFVMKNLWNLFKWTRQKTFYSPFQKYARHVKIKLCWWNYFFLSLLQKMHSIVTPKIWLALQIVTRNEGLSQCPLGDITPNKIPLTTIVTYLQNSYRSRISNHWATIPACSVVTPYLQTIQENILTHIMFSDL